jgi:hypothetical protein
MGVAAMAGSMPAPMGAAAVRVTTTSMRTDRARKRPWRRGTSGGWPLLMSAWDEELPQVMSREVKNKRSSSLGGGGER